MIKKILMLIFISVLILNAQDAPIHHEISATITPNTSYLEVTDEITLDESQVKDGLQFKLHNALEVEPNDMITKLDESVNAEDIGMDKDDAGDSHALFHHCRH